ncbi:MAG: hypothetical protein GY841_15685 [FCB group bacterium]|nr:hypothetical protein [FCB group bacterium]
MSAFESRLEGAKSPYFGKITLGAESGQIITGENKDDPPLQILESDISDVESLHVQVVKVTDHETGEAAYVRRIVAKIGEDREFDIVDPVAISADVAELGIDTSKCEACTMPLDGFDLVFHEGAAYHKYCLDEGGD